MRNLGLDLLPCGEETLLALKLLPIPLLPHSPRRPSTVVPKFHHIQGLQSPREWRDSSQDAGPLGSEFKERMPVWLPAKAGTLGSWEIYLKGQGKQVSSLTEGTLHWLRQKKVATCYQSKAPLESGARGQMRHQV